MFSPRSKLRGETWLVGSRCSPKGCEQIFACENRWPVTSSRRIPKEPASASRSSVLPGPRPTAYGLPVLGVSELKPSGSAAEDAVSGAASPPKSFHSRGAYYREISLQDI